MTNALSFRDVSIMIGKKHALAESLMTAGLSSVDIRTKTGVTIACRSVTFDVKQGEILVLMGLSGSGKSTLLRAACGLIRPPDVYIIGDIAAQAQGFPGGVLNPSRARDVELRKFRQFDIAMMFQKTALLPWRTVLENVLFPFEVRKERKDYSLARARELLELVRLTPWADNWPSELSGGMQQRVALARALASGAPLLLMDEPFSALDPLIRHHLQTELLALQGRLGFSLLFVTHDLTEALRLGHRIAILEAGDVVQVGTPSDIVNRPATPFVREFVECVSCASLSARERPGMAVAAGALPRELS